MSFYAKRSLPSAHIIDVSLLSRPIATGLIVIFLLMTVLHSRPSLAQEATQLKASVSTRNAKGSDESFSANIEATHIDLGSAARVLEVLPPATVTRAHGKTEKLERSTLVFAGDSIEVGPNSRALVQLNDAKQDKDKSTLILLPKSKITIDAAKADGPENLREVRIILESGELRAQVPPASDPVLPTFHVQLPTTHLNAKSGDFMVTLIKDESDWHTRVRVLEGSATLLTERAVDDKKDFLDIGAGQQGEFIHKAINAGASVGIVQQTINHGDFTEATAMDGGERAAFLKETDIQKLVAVQQKTQQKLAANAEKQRILLKKQKVQLAKQQAAAASLCRAPDAQYNQCSWTCEGKNPKKSANCRTELSGVACVRRICRADGQWREETRLPASDGNLCPASGSTVHECGNYW